MLVPPWTPGTNAADQTFTITNTGTDILNYTITDNATWLNCVPASGSSTGESDTITVKYTTSTLAPGTYYGVITIRGNATNTPVTIQVTLTCFDVFPPVVTITSPTTDPTLVIRSATPLVDLAGTAIDDSGNISSVNWVNDTGGSGTCTGTTNWSVSGIGLVIGPNNITISATDPDGNEGSDTITIIYSDDFVAPEASVSTITLEGTAFNESPDNYEIPTLLVNGTTVITTAGAWTVTDIPLTGALTTINIFGTDASSNTRQVQLVITK
jgi:hypothetical protein